MIFSKILEDEKLFEEYVKELEETIETHKEAMINVRKDIYDLEKQLAELETKVLETTDNDEKNEIIKKIIEIEDEIDVLWETYYDLKDNLEELVEELETLYDLKKGVEEVEQEIEAETE